MDYETIEYKVEEAGIGILSLNRPRKYNCVNHRMMEELDAFWKEGSSCSKKSYYRKSSTEL